MFTFIADIKDSSSFFLSFFVWRKWADLLLPERKGGSQKEDAVQSLMGDERFAAQDGEEKTIRRQNKLLLLLPLLLVLCRCPPTRSSKPNAKRRASCNSPRCGRRRQWLLLLLLLLGRRGGNATLIDYWPAACEAELERKKVRRRKKNSTIWNSY